MAKTTEQTRAKVLEKIKELGIGNQWLYFIGGSLTMLLILMLPIGFMFAIITVGSAVGSESFQSLRSFVASFIPEIAGIAFTVLILDRRAEMRARRQLKSQLIREVGSSDNGIAQRATGELRTQGWINDGSLRQANLQEANLFKLPLAQVNLQGANLNGANLAEADLRFANLQDATLIGANLQQAYLRGADLSETNLYRAQLQNANLAETNLTGAHLRSAVLRECNLFLAILDGSNLRSADCQNAKLSNASLIQTNLSGVDFTGATGLRDEQIVRAKSLRGALMPDGGKYNGQYRLEGDFRDAQRENLKTDDSSTMASFFGVSLEDYLAGQELAERNLGSLRKKPREQ